MVLAEYDELKRPRFNYIPVHDLPKGIQLRSPPILIIEVIGVFPDVEGQQGFIAFGDGIVRIGLLRNHQSAVGLS